MKAGKGGEQVGRRLIRTLLLERIGLDTETVGPHFLDEIIRQTLRMCTLNNVDELATLLTAKREVWQLLVQQATVNESWFLRDGKPFDLFVQLVQRLWQTSAGMPIRVLSYPCACGEEPYSLRIALAEAGIPQAACQLTAADVNEASLQKAREGIYTARSLRACTEDLISRYFNPAGESLWQIRESLAGGIDFVQANLLEDEAALGTDPYQIIFCRNLLIYQSTEARQNILSVLLKRLSADGVLVVGNAEAGIVRDAGFAAVGEPGAFAFQAKDARSQVGKQRLSEKSQSRGGSKLLQRQASLKATCEEKRLVDEPGGAQTLESIQALADAGEVEQALKACKVLLIEQPGLVEGHYLFGLLHSACGHRADARMAFRKVLYLDAAHVEARLHLGLPHVQHPLQNPKQLNEHRGDAQ